MLVLFFSSCALCFIFVSASQYNILFNNLIALPVKNKERSLKYILFQEDGGFM